MGISTNGWDLVYANKFPVINNQLKYYFDKNDKNVQTIKTAVANTIAGGYDNNGVLAVINDKGKGYNAPPKINISGTSSPSEEAEFKASLEVTSIEVTNSGTGYQTAPTISINGDGQGATATAKIVVNEINVKNSGFNYGPTVTISGGSGSGAAIGNIDITDGTVTAIEVTNGGSGYSVSNPPTITINGGGGSGASAKAKIENGKITGIEISNKGTGYITANLSSGNAKIDKVVINNKKVAAIQLADNGSGYDMTNPPTVTITGGGGFAANAIAVVGLKIEVKASGQGYTSLPTIAITGGGGSGASAKAVCAVHGVTTVNSGKGYKLPPLLSVEGNKGATAFAMMKFKVPDSMYDSSKDTITSFLNKITPRAIAAWGEEMVGIHQEIAKYKNELIANLAQITITPGSGDKVYEYFEKYAAETIKAFIEVTKGSLNKTLELLYKGKDAKEGSDYKKEAKYIAEAYSKKTIDDAISLIMDIEAEAAKARVRKALRSQDATIIFNLNQDPAQGDAYAKKIGELSIATVEHRTMLVEAVVNVTAVLYHPGNANELVSIGKIVNLIDYNFQKIKLLTGPWKLIPGGDSDKVNIRIPVLGGHLMFGATNKIIEEKNYFYIDIALQLAWIKYVYSADLTIPKDKSIEVLTFQEDTKHSGYIPSKLEEAEILLIKHYIYKCLNSKKYPNPKPEQHILNPVDDAYQYSHTFAVLNIFPEIAEDEAQFAWMYPTSFAYAVKDEYSIDPNPEKSVFAVCCMTEGRENSDKPDVDISAIPIGSDSAILLSGERLLEHMVLDHFISQFFKDNKDPEKSTATRADFERVEPLKYSNNIPLNTYALNIKKGDDKKNVTIPARGASIRIDTTRIKMEFLNGIYEYDDDTKVKIQRVYEFTFGRVIDEKTKKSTWGVSPKRVTDKQDVIYKEGPETHWYEVLGSILIEFLVTTVTTIIVGRMVECICTGKKGAKNSGTFKEEDSPEKRRAKAKEICEKHGGKFSPRIELAELPQKVDCEKVALENLGEVKFQAKTYDKWIVEDTNTIEYTLEKFDMKFNNENNKYEMRIRVTDGEITNAYLITLKNGDLQDIEVNPSGLVPEDIAKKFIEELEKLDNAELNKIFKKPKVSKEVSSSALDNSRAAIIDAGVKEPETKAEKDKFRRRVDEAIKTKPGLEKKKARAELITGFVSMALTGIGIYFYFDFWDEKYKAYKRDVDKFTKNRNDSGVNVLTDNFAKKIEFPSIGGTKTYNEFTLNESLIIGFNHSLPKLEGYVSAFNSHMPLAHYTCNSEHQFKIHNSGDYPIAVGFVKNELAYEGLMEVELGNHFTIPEHSTQIINVDDFNISPDDQAILLVQAVENDATYQLEIMRKKQY